MPSTFTSQTAGEADEQAREQERQRDVHFQIFGESNLGHEQTMYYKCLCEDLSPPTGSQELEPGLDLLASTLKSESDRFDWETAFGINTPRSSSSESDCSQETTIPSVFGNVLDGDNINLGPQFPAGGPIKSQDDIVVASKPATNSRKRSSTEAFASEQVEDDIGRAKQKAKTDADKQEKTRLQFACPFQKLDPLKHHECLKYALHRIKDVKQHVYRRHKQPDYYCARCFVVFETADARDEHARSKDCENKKGPGFEGITDVEKNKLNKNPSRGLEAREQWFRMWDIIFPGKKKPTSVLVGSYIEEMVPLLRSLWTRKNSKILAMAQKDQASPVDPSLLDGVVQSIFDCLEIEASASVGERRRGTSSLNQHCRMGGESLLLAHPSRLIDESVGTLYAEPQYFFQDINGDPEAEISGLVFGEG